MRHRPLFVIAGSLATALVAASAFALDGPAQEPVAVAAAQDDDPSSDDLGLTGDDVPDDSPSPDHTPSPDDSPSPDGSASPSDRPSVDDSPSPDGTPTVAMGSETYAVADAGTVTVAATPDGLLIAEVASATGWSGHVEDAQGREVEVTFRSGEARVDFKAEIEDGDVRIRVRDRRVEDLEDARRDDEEEAADEDRSGSSDDPDDDSDDDSDDTELTDDTDDDSVDDDEDSVDDEDSLDD